VIGDIDEYCPAEQAEVGQVNDTETQEDGTEYKPKQERAPQQE